MKNKLKVLLPLLFVIALIAVIPLAVNADECSHANLTHVEAVEPRCHFEGNLEYWYCADCGQCWLNEELTYKVSRIFVTLPSYDPPLEYISAGTKMPCYTIDNDCWYCAECDSFWSVGMVLCSPAETHHNITHVEAVEPRCHFEGNLEYWYCADCNQCWLNEELTYKVSRIFVTLPTLDVDMTHIEEIAPTCTTPGNIEYWLCEECGLKIPCVDDLYIPEIEYDIPALGHDWSDWSDNGVEQSRSCGRCGEIERNVLTDDISIDALTITVNNLDGVRDFFIAPGRYETYAEVKAAYTARIVVANLGGAESASKTVSKPGEYTVLVRYNDSSVAHAIHHVTLDVPTPEIIADGLRLTVSGLNDAKVIRYAPGEWSSARELRAADGYRAVKASALKGADIFTAAIANEGVYTIIVEYYNGLVVVEQVTIEAKIPAFTQDGNKVTFGNLDDMYVLRYAKGEHTTSAEIKRAEGARYLRPSAVDANGEITVELDEGIYTFCVQYNDGSYNYYTVTV